MAEVETIEELIARNFAADVAAGEGVSPDDAPKVKRPLPPVGHFGYTEEDADAIREENRDAVLETSETVNEPTEGDAGTITESAADNAARAERAAAESRQAQRQAAESEAAQRASQRSDSESARRTDRAESSGADGGDGRRTAKTSAKATDKNRQNVPAGQSRSGAESKGDDGDNTNNPRDESNKK